MARSSPPKRNVTQAKTDALPAAANVSSAPQSLPKRRKFSILEARRALQFIEGEGYKPRAVSFLADGAVKIEFGDEIGAAGIENPWDKAVGNG